MVVKQTVQETHQRVWMVFATKWITTHHWGLHPVPRGGTEDKGDGSWPKRKPTNAPIQGAIARQLGTANIVDRIAKGPAAARPSLAIVGMGGVLLAERRARRGSFFDEALLADFSETPWAALKTRRCGFYFVE
jgi:hypothetical protein